MNAAAPMPTAARKRKSPQNPRDNPARKAKMLQTTTPAAATARRERRSLSTPKGNTATEKSSTKAEAIQPMCVSVRWRSSSMGGTSAKTTLRLT